jgi:integrase
MSILKTKAGKLGVRFMYRGQRVYVSTGLEDTAQNRRLAKSIEAQRRRELIEGREGLQRPNAQTFQKAWTEFIEHEHKARKESTWRRIVTSGATLTAFLGSKTVYLISAGDVEQYKVWRLSGEEEHGIFPVKPVTVRHDLDNLSLFFQWAKKHKYCRENLLMTGDVERPGEGDVERAYILSVNEERKYFAFLQRESISENGNLHDSGRLMIQQGLRPEEVMALPKANFDIEKRTLTVGKSKTKKGSGRAIKLTAESWQILARRVSSPGSWLFPSSRRMGAHITKLNCPHDRALKRLGMSFVIYDLRHTFATRFIEAGGDVAVLKDIMGHKDLRTTMRYVHLSQEHQFAAMEKFEQYRLAIEKRFDQREINGVDEYSEGH